MKSHTAPTGEARRALELEWLHGSSQPLSAASLAQRLGVSRQVIVQDVAILRAAGHDILATARGYLLPVRPAPGTVREVLALQHRPEETTEELNILVDYGLKVVDVVVEHPLYGEIRGLLMLESREDVRRFVEEVEQHRASLLSTLTGGLHLHTVEAPRAELIAKARVELASRGFLAGE